MGPQYCPVGKAGLVCAGPRCYDKGMGMSFIMLLFVGGALLGTGALVFGGIFVLVSSKKKRLGAALLAVGLLMGVCEALVFSFLFFNA